MVPLAEMMELASGKKTCFFAGRLAFGNQCNGIAECVIPPELTFYCAKHGREVSEFLSGVGFYNLELIFPPPLDNE